MPFRSTSRSKKKTELVVFLTPQIILADGSPYVPPAVDRLDEASLPEVILQDPVPAAYRRAVGQRLERYLAEQFRLAGFSRGAMVLSFVLGHDGRLIGAPEVTSPQGEGFVSAAATALTEAQPFPPFPPGSQADEVRFRIAVEYAPDVSRDAEDAWQANPGASGNPEDSPAVTE